MTATEQLETQMASSETSDHSLDQVLSALADGECSEFELRRLLVEMKADETLGKRLLAKWHVTQVSSSLIQNSGRHAPQAFPSEGFASRVSSALDEENTHRSIGHWWKPLSQGLVAASVAALALVGIQQQAFVVNDSAPVVETAAVDSGTSSFVPVVIPEGFEAPELRTQNVSATQTVRILPQPQPNQNPAEQLDPVELNAFIQSVLDSHYESSVQSSGSVFPYVRSVEIQAQ